MSKPLFIPNKLRNVVKQHNSNLASNYEPEYDRLHNEGKLNYNLPESSTTLSTKEKLKEDFAKNKVQNTVPRIGSNQEIIWNKGFKQKNNSSYYDEELSSYPIEDESSYEDQNQTLAKEDFTHNKSNYSNFNNLKQEQKKAFEKQHSQAVLEKKQPDEMMELKTIPDNSYILINAKTSETLHVSLDVNEISEVIESLLQDDFDLEDLIVLNKLKISVGVILT